MLKYLFFCRRANKSRLKEALVKLHKKDRDSVLRDCKVFRSRFLFSARRDKAGNSRKGWSGRHATKNVENNVNG